MPDTKKFKKLIVFLSALVVSLALYGIFYTSPQWEGTDFLDEAIQNEENGNFNEAAENYKKHLEYIKRFHQTEIEARHLAKIAELYYKQNKLPEAEKSLKEAISLSTSPEPSFSFQLGLLYYERDFLPQADYFFKQTARANPAYPGVKRALSFVSIEREAEKKFKSAQSSHFILKTRREEMAQTQQLLAVLEEAHEKLSAVYPFTLHEKSIVKILDDFTFAALTGKAPQNTSGVSINGKLFIRSPRLSPIGENLKEIIVHEYTHLLFHKLLPGTNPVWVHEGLAAYFSGEYKNNVHEKVVRHAVQNDTLLPLASLSASWNTLPPESRTLAYAESAYLIDFLLEHYSWNSLYKFIFYLSAGHNEEDSIEKIFSTTTQSLQKNLARWLEEKKL